jgi:hypothetical protein
MCHALLEGWVGYDCMISLDLESLAPQSTKQPPIQLQRPQTDLELHPSRNKQKPASAKEYSAAKECLKSIPVSAQVQVVAHSALSKARRARSISACPTPVKV